MVIGMGRMAEALALATTSLVQVTAAVEGKETRKTTALTAPAWRLSVSITAVSRHDARAEPSLGCRPER